MRCGNTWRAVGTNPDIMAAYIPVATNNLACRRVPYYKLAAWGLHKVVFVNIAFLSGTSAGASEGYLAQSSYLTHGCRALGSGKRIYLISRLIGRAKHSLRSKFGFNQLCRNRWYYRFFHFTVIIGYIQGRVYGQPLQLPRMDFQAQARESLDQQSPRIFCLVN